MNGRRRVMGWGALGCSNLTASGAPRGVARDVTVTIRHFITYLIVLFIFVFILILYVINLNNPTQLLLLEVSNTVRSPRRF